MSSLSSLTSAQKALSEVMALYNKEMTDFEIMLWTKIIADHGDAPVIRVLLKHCEKSVFAPKPADALAVLCPGNENPMVALEELVRVARKTGPYEDPDFKDRALASTVLLLGGWVTVNEQLPDPTDRFAYEAYYKRFDALYKQAQADLMTNGGQAPVLLGLHSLSVKTAAQLLLAAQGKAQEQARLGLSEVQR